jgi:signal transduction protein with GAF and PtsI domain
MKVKACSLRLLDAKGKKLLMGASEGLSEAYIKKGPILVEGSGLDQKVLKGKTIFLKDARTDKNFQYGTKAAAEGIKSVLAVPLKVEKKAVGVMRAYTDRVREFNPQEIRFLEAVANLSAIALDNARLHKRIQTRFNLMSELKDRIDDN